MEDFDKYFVIEVQTSKGWEVNWTCNDLTDALNKFQRELDSEPIMPVRLTSPTDVSIYDPADLPARATIGRPASVELNPPQHQ